MHYIILGLAFNSSSCGRLGCLRATFWVTVSDASLCDSAPVGTEVLASISGLRLRFLAEISLGVWLFFAFLVFWFFLSLTRA